MNYNKIFRIFIAFLMVCCILVNVSPLKAHATSIVYSSVAVEAWNVISSILIGLGVMVGTTTTEFNRIVELIISSLNLGDFIDVICWVASGFQKYAVPQSLVESVRACLFSSSVLTEELSKSCSLPAGSTFVTQNYGTCTVRADCYAFLYRYGNLSTVSVILIPYDFVSASNLLMCADGSYHAAGNTYTNRGWTYYVSADCSESNVAGLDLNLVKSAEIESHPVAVFCNGGLDFSPETIVVSEYDVSLGNVGPISTSFNEAYLGWAEGSVNIPSDDSSEDDKVYVPIGLGQSSEETSTMTQEQVQSGESTYVDSTVDSVTSSWLGNWFNSLVSSLSTWFNNVISEIKSIPDAFSTWFEDVISGLESIPEKILLGIQAIFVPSEDFLSAKVEALRARFDFINVFIDFIDGFKGEFSGATPPVIYLHLENAEGSYNYGGTVKFLDMSWYSRYKGTGDALISGFLWALFGWRMYLKLPGIINGVSGGVGSMSSRYKKDGD